MEIAWKKFGSKLIESIQWVKTSWYFHKVYFVTMLFVDNIKNTLFLQTSIIENAMNIIIISN